MANHVSEAKSRANKKWDDENKAKKRVYRYRSYTRKFVREMAKADDLDELRILINQRERELVGK